MESIAIAKQLAAKHKYILDSSTELIGLAVANSQSAVNKDCSAKSGIPGIITATIPHMPLANLAAIFISVVLGLVDY